MLRFNFAEVKESQLAKYLNPDILFALIVIIGILSVTYLQKTVIQQEISKIQSDISRLQAEKRRLSAVAKEEKILKKKKEELNRKLSVISQLDKSRNVPSFLYFFANPSNTKGIWLDAVFERNKNALFISGYAYNLNRLSDFLKKVSQNLGDITFKDAYRKTYENKELKLKINYYTFQVNVERK
ncbi:type IV pilus assembly protein PilN [Desulfurobacterium pacificum]|jgi:type IV pilus assembly protein PilN|uniref:Type IV pilus assembly protein PilN n=1 Tax=Desulfurobacterium pacificum TaxID=240166 RepID=A0ABY1NA44_9BACT|nr:hypothetical protein [Desulfurobacterium pacificum]SMP04600.1 type IV pilus assembly protein PilN [Desulfurobacterium pacificum]